MDHHRLRWIVALVVVALALAWWVTRSGLHSPGGDAPIARDSEPAPVALAESVREKTLATRSTAAISTAMVAPRQDSPDDWVVLVVDASTKLPVAGAEVAWTSKQLMLRDKSRPLIVYDPESALDADARWIETDEHGLVRLAPNALPGIVCARHGAAFGSTSVFERRETVVQVSLRRALHLDIQVVDAGGHPVAGVPVALHAADTVQGAQPIWTGITAGDAGIARARHFEIGLARLKPPFDLVADFEFPTRTVSTVPVDVEHLPLEPLRLVLPPAGSVEILVHDSLGGPVLPMEVDLNVTAAGERDFTVTPNLRQFTPAIVEKGRALFPFVETGIDISAQVVVNLTFLHANGPGPRVNGERVVMEIDTGSAKPLLVGRLVDEAGNPLLDANVTYVLQFTYDVGGRPLMAGGTSPLKTTASGRFEVMSAADAQVPVKGTLSFKSFSGAVGAGGFGSLALDGPLHDGENDVGDIVVRKPTVLVTGHIVDEQGAPLGSPSIDVEVEGSLHGLLTWESDKGTRATCDENGAFRIVSAYPQSKVRIRVRRTGYLQLDPCQVASGARDVKIALTKASEISGSVIVDPDIPLTEITVFVRALSEPEVNWREALPSERVKVRPDGTFRLVDVRPLVVDLAVRRSGMKEPLVVVPNLDLRGGGPAKDLRLSGIDLRGRLPIVPLAHPVGVTPR